MKGTNKSLRLYISFLLLTALFISALFFSLYLNSYEPKATEASLFNKYREASSPLTKERIKLIPLGSAFGIKLFTEGVIVTGIEKTGSEGGLCSPAYDAGIRAGDYILEAEGEYIDNNKELSKIIKFNKDESILLKVKRGQEIFETELMLYKVKGVNMAGMWIKDSALGIGTLSYCDPETGEFAGLGHGICDIDTESLINIKGGLPESIVISSIDKAIKGTPGRINGYFSGLAPLGELTLNTETGIYGKLAKMPEGEAIEIAFKDEVKQGEAFIKAAIDNEGPKLYRVYIERVIEEGRKVRNMIIRVEDELLLSKTGGIIQGMSGSPIIQDGKLIGAVTHVLVNDPTRGYGIFIENMLNAAS